MDTSLPMPWCPDSKRSAPNILIRSSLFGVVENGKRERVDNKTICSAKNTEIKYTGEQLNQADFDVWVELIHIASKPDFSNGIKSEISFSGSSFLQSIGRHCGGVDFKRLKSSLRRLKHNLIEIKNGKLEYVGALLDEVSQDNKSGRITVNLDKNLAKLFSGYTQLHVERRLQLKGKQVCLWLYNFYSSHEDTDIYNYSVETLMKLCGSKQELKKFKYELKGYLAELEKVTQWDCTIDREGLIHINKSCDEPF